MLDNSKNNTSPNCINLFLKTVYMTLLKLSNRWNCIHQLIKQENTGSLRTFAKRVGISKSQLSRELNDMILMGAPIEYNETIKTYMYSQKVEFKFEFKRPS